jgi:hypothetical protein
VITRDAAAMYQFNHADSHQGRWFQSMDVQIMTFGIAPFAARKLTTGTDLHGV